jgi:hypothetical protein
MLSDLHGIELGREGLVVEVEGEESRFLELNVSMCN